MDVVGEDLGRITITTARYGGAYETGVWVAFARSPDELPHDWDADDVTAMSWWVEHRHEVGGGNSPDAALEDLRRKLAERGRS